MCQNVSYDWCTKHQQVLQLQTICREHLYWNNNNGFPVNQRNNLFFEQKDISQFKTT